MLACDMADNSASLLFLAQLSDKRTPDLSFFDPPVFIQKFLVLVIFQRVQLLEILVLESIFVSLMSRLN